MKKSFLYILFLLLCQFSFAQNKLSWQGYFSFNEIKDISQSSTAVFAASENALFSKKAATNAVKTTTTVDGLSGQTISALYHSEGFKKTIIGYENGLMIAVNETDGSILKVVDIISKQLPANLKRINHFMEHNGLIYVSCDFGIVQFNLTTLKFGDTYFIGDNGAEISVKQTAYFDGFIYAATSNGIRKANSINANLIDFNQWLLVNSGNWSSVETLDSELIAINSGGYIHRYNSNTFVGFLQLSQASTDMRAVNHTLLITTPNTVFVYNNQMILNRQITNTQVLNNTLSFSCATVIGDLLYIGTKDKGLFSSMLLNSSTFENNTPSGPSRNSLFAIQTTSNSLWAVYGDYSGAYNPYPKDSYGISKFTQTGWSNIPYEKVLGAKSLVRIAVDPANEKKVYIGSFDAGLLKLENDVPTYLYGTANSSLQAVPNTQDIWVNGMVFDKSGNLWMNNSLVDNGIKMLKPNGDWQVFSTKSVIANVSSCPFGRMSIDKNGTKWMATYNSGIIGFNEKGNVIKKITSGADTGNLPFIDARVATPDNNGQLWIGTTKGLRVLSSVNSFQTDSQLTTKPIIIVEDGLAQELLYEQFITDIVVDGSNNKWIATADSGVFMVSPNGQETKYHFTINNSPLPSNTINDIDIDSTTGEVFIATDKGLISFKGTSTAANENLNDVYVYPNPVRPQFTGTVKIAGLLDKANIKITDIEGNLVYETTSEGGTIEWDTTAFGRYKVASGVYMIFISAQDGGETKVKKVMIIR
ncbi:T9SS type A sorting domain-containing protein [[Flexibacter] sp. ATCC 35103]|uniref:type IX secretion system anionic LPS delivery protein PorZ n=1 Tax=[Flexibacter] sp. ATCC 35103 TaxID=1937528 RepID=UPI0009D0AD35|nr:T9SS type A sorting domain-containing protein [[Flexibacter] sp. ATCC 35103]OMQ12631.1 ABC transporter substrate-binding protein [[Flexibacter] sp. ATCC 35103]